MITRIATFFTAFLATTAAVIAGVAVLSGTATASPAAAKPKTVPILMHDPGCHWFLVGGAFKTKLAVGGPTAFRNSDEAALVFKGQGKVVKLPVGKTLTISRPGTYHVTMVGQAPDDNHLLLVVR